MLHPMTELRLVSPAIGLGIFATQDIPRGSITWVRDTFDQVFSPEAVRALGGQHARILDHFGYRDGRGNTILCWDHARYMNHSCASTNLSPGWDFEIAVRDIPAGSEMTDDYGGLGLERPFACLCGSEVCRKHVLPDDHARLATGWDARIAETLKLLRTVNQPLWDLVAEKADVEAVLRGDKAPPSTLVHYCGRTTDGTLGTLR